jgi:hypothetical protein
VCFIVAIDYDFLNIDYIEILIEKELFESKQTNYCKVKKKKEKKKKTLFGRKTIVIKCEHFFCVWGQSILNY